MNMNMGGYGGYSDKSQFTTNCNFINVSSPQQVKEFNVKAGDVDAGDRTVAELCSDYPDNIILARLEGHLKND